MSIVLVLLVGAAQAQSMTDSPTPTYVPSFMQTPFPTASPSVSPTFGAIGSLWGERVVSSVQFSPDLARAIEKSGEVQSSVSMSDKYAVTGFRSEDTPGKLLLFPLEDGFDQGQERTYVDDNYLCAVSVATAGQLVTVGCPSAVGGVGYVRLVPVNPLNDELADNIVSEGSVSCPENCPSFGTAVALSPTGRFLLVGAPEEDRAYLFEVISLTPPSAVYIEGHPRSGNLEGSYFGFSLAVTEETLFIGAPYYQEATGLVYYSPTDGSPSSGNGTFQNDDGFAGDFFGWSIDASRRWVIVGSPGTTSKGFETGSAHLFENQLDFFPWSRALNASDAGTRDRFGASVALEEDLIVVGAPGKQETGLFGSGSVYFFLETILGWEESQVLLDTGPFDMSSFGTAVAMTSSFGHLVVSDGRSFRVAFFTRCDTSQFLDGNDLCSDQLLVGETCPNNAALQQPNQCSSGLDACRGRCCASSRDSLGCAACSSSGACLSCSSNFFLTSGICDEKRASGEACDDEVDSCNGGPDLCRELCCLSARFAENCAVCGMDGFCEVCLPSYILTSGSCVASVSRLEQNASVIGSFGGLAGASLLIGLSIFGYRRIRYSRTLPRRCKHHVFISHVQSTGGLQASLLSEWLRKQRFSVWLDKQEEEITLINMQNGIKEAAVYLLLLTPGVLKSTFVLNELLTAFKENKPIILVHERGFNFNTSNADFAENAPEILVTRVVPNLFRNLESIEFDRRERRKNLSITAELISKRYFNRWRYKIQDLRGINDDEYNLAMVSAL